MGYDRLQETGYGLRTASGRSAGSARSGGRGPLPRASGPLVPRVPRCAPLPQSWGRGFRSGTAGALRRRPSPPRDCDARSSHRQRAPLSQSWAIMGEGADPSRFGRVSGLLSSSTRSSTPGHRQLRHRVDVGGGAMSARHPKEGSPKKFRYKPRTGLSAPSGRSCAAMLALSRFPISAVDSAVDRATARPTRRSLSHVRLKPHGVCEAFCLCCRGFSRRAPSGDTSGLPPRHPSGLPAGAPPTSSRPACPTRATPPASHLPIPPHRSNNLPTSPHHSPAFRPRARNSASFFRLL